MSLLVFGNERLKAAAKAAALSGNGMRVIVLEGPAGSGKRTLARYLATTFLCESSTPPCGDCNTCRLIEKGMHPDVIIPEKDRKKVISVEQIKRLRTDAYIRPHVAKEKVYLFEDAEELNTEGQNALLKLLEEPPATARFIILCRSRSHLLPTVLSRSTLYTAEALTHDLMDAFLRQAAPDMDPLDREDIIRLSGGYAGRALELITKGNAMRKAALNYLKTAARKDEFALYRLGETLAGDTNTDLDTFIGALRDFLCLSAKSAAGLGYAGEETVPEFGKEKVYSLLEALNHVAGYRNANLSASAFFAGLTTSFASILV